MDIEETEAKTVPSESNNISLQTEIVTLPSQPVSLNEGTMMDVKKECDQTLPLSDEHTKNEVINNNKPAKFQRAQSFSSPFVAAYDKVKRRKKPGESLAEPIYVGVMTPTSAERALTSFLEADNMMGYPEALMWNMQLDIISHIERTREKKIARNQGSFMIDEKFGHVLQAAHAPSCMLKGPHLRYSSVFSILDSVCKDPYVAVAGITQQIKTTSSAEEWDAELSRLMRRLPKILPEPIVSVHTIDSFIGPCRLGRMYIVDSMASIEAWALNTSQASLELNPLDRASIHNSRHLLLWYQDAIVIEGASNQPVVYDRSCLPKSLGKEQEEGYDEMKANDSADSRMEIDQPVDNALKDVDSATRSAAKVLESISSREQSNKQTKKRAVKQLLYLPRPKHSNDKQDALNSQVETPDGSAETPNVRKRKRKRFVIEEDEQVDVVNDKPPKRLKDNTPISPPRTPKFLGLQSLPPENAEDRRQDATYVQPYDLLVHEQEILSVVLAPFGLFPPWPGVVLTPSSSRARRLTKKRMHVHVVFPSKDVFEPQAVPVDQILPYTKENEEAAYNQYLSFTPDRAEALELDFLRAAATVRPFISKTKEWTDELGEEITQPVKNQHNVKSEPSNGAPDASTTDKQDVADKDQPEPSVSNAGTTQIATESNNTKSI